MKLNQPKTYTLKTSEIKREWHLYDADGKVLGRLATEIATILMGKNKPNYTPHIDNGDFVVVINASKIAVTGRKLTDKIYYRHSNYPGGFKQETLAEKMEKDPTKVIELAVKGMLPKNKLQKKRLRRLKVYAGQQHPHNNHFNAKSNQAKSESDKNNKNMNDKEEK